MHELHVIMTGRVQGVGFRDFTIDEALQLKLAGWVRNLDDGRVQVYARGSAEAVAKLRKWLETGPPLARVDTIEDLPVTSKQRSISPSLDFVRLPTGSM